MEVINICPKQHSIQLLEHIERLDSRGALATARVESESPFVIQETMVQLAALHVRHHLHCERHVFLLAVQQWQLHVPWCEIPGPLSVGSTITAASSDGYACQAALIRHSTILAEGSYLFGTVAYGGAFDESRLRPHYEEVIRCLSAGKYN